MLYRTPTVLRFIVILAVSFALPFLFPLVPAAAGSGSNVIPMMLLFSFLIGFLINRAVERKQLVASSIAVELSRLRRVRHIAAETSDQAWKDLLSAKVSAYERTMGVEFFQSEKTVPSYRQMSELVYGFRPRDGREEILLQALLQSTGDIALERQRRAAAVGSKMSWYSWLVMSAYAFLIILILISNRQEHGFTAMSVGATIAGVLIVMDLLYRLNQYSKRELAEFRAKYEGNAATTEKSDSNI